MQKHLVADDFFVVDFGFVHGSANQRVDALVFVVKAQVPRHVIDAGTEVIDFFVGDANPARQHFGGALDAVTEPRDGDVAFALHGTTEHSHRVGVIEHHCVGAVFFHVFSNCEHFGDGAQGPEDARRTAGIAHIDIDPVLLGDFDIVAPYVHAASQNSDHYHVSALERFGA